VSSMVYLTSIIIKSNDSCASIDTWRWLAPAQVLISGMRELGAVEPEDIVIGGGSSSKKEREGEGEGGEAVGGGWEGLIEVVCVTEFKRLVTYRVRGDLDEGVAHALAGGLRR
jgi:hypothetical protein